MTCPDCGAERRILAFIEEDRRHRKNSQASGPTPRRLARSAAPGARLRADLQRLARRGRRRRCLPALLSAQRAFGDGPFLLPGARTGHPEAQNAPEPAREAQNGVDNRSGDSANSERAGRKSVSAPKPNLEGDVLLLDPKTKFLSLIEAAQTVRLERIVRSILSPSDVYVCVPLAPGARR